MKIYRIAQEIFDGYIYHGTSKGAALGIQRDGYMTPKNTGEIKPSVSFTKSFDYAKYYASAKGGSDKSVVLRTKLDDRFSISERISDNKGDEYVTFEPVSTSRLEIFVPDGSWQPLENWDVIYDEVKA